MPALPGEALLFVSLRVPMRAAAALLTGSEVRARGQGHIGTDVCASQKRPVGLFSNPTVPSYLVISRDPWHPRVAISYQRSAISFREGKALAELAGCAERMGDRSRLPPGRGAVRSCCRLHFAALREAEE